MPKPIDLSEVFTQNELMFLLEGLYSIQEYKKNMMEQSNAIMLHLHTSKIEPSDFGLDILENLIEQFASASIPTMQLVPTQKIL